MKTWLTMIVLLLAPISATGGLIYKIAAGEIKDPTFYLLVVILPSSILPAVKELRSVIPPDRITATIQSGIRGKQWEQASNWDEQSSRKLTSLYIPIRLANDDSEKSVTLYDVKVTEKSRNVNLAPPQKADVPIAGKRQWMFLACDLAFADIFNSSQTEVPNNSRIDTQLIIQEEGHWDHYELTIDFKDTYERHYSLNCSIDVTNCGWTRGTTEWST